MRNQNTTKTDSSKSSTFKSKSTSKRIQKKVGHKGDYAIVEVGNPFITSVKTGSGTTGDPYVYTVDLSSDLTSDLTSERTSSETLKTDTTTFKYRVENSKFLMSDHTPDTKTLSFSSLIETNSNSHTITNTEIANNTDVNYTTTSSHTSESSISNNSIFSINISKLNIPPKTVIGVVDLDGYDVEIISKDINKIQFKITYNKINITNKHLLDESDLKISFIIEW